MKERKIAMSPLQKMGVRLIERYGRCIVVGNDGKWSHAFSNRSVAEAFCQQQHLPITVVKVEE